MRLSRLLKADLLVCFASLSILTEEGNQCHPPLLMRPNVAQPVEAFVLAVPPSRSGKQLHGVDIVIDCFQGPAVCLESGHL